MTRGRFYLHPNQESSDKGKGDNMRTRDTLMRGGADVSHETLFNSCSAQMNISFFCFTRLFSAWETSINENLTAKRLYLGPLIGGPNPLGPGPGGPLGPGPWNLGGPS